LNIIDAYSLVFFPLKNDLSLDMVEHACNSTYAGGGDGRMLVQDQPKQKLSEFLAQKKAGCGSYNFNLSYSGGGSRRVPVRGLPQPKTQHLL
jgi:hypothetical protein